MVLAQSSASGAEKTSTEPDCAVLFEEDEEETATEAVTEAEEAVTEAAEEADDVIVQDNNRIGSRSGRFLMYRPLTRLFAGTLNLGTFTLLSTGSGLYTYLIKPRLLLELAKIRRTGSPDSKSSIHI